MIGHTCCSNARWRLLKPAWVPRIQRPLLAEPNSRLCHHGSPLQTMLLFKAANGPIDAAEATDNSGVLSFALPAYGSAFRDADPAHGTSCAEAWRSLKTATT